MCMHMFTYVFVRVHEANGANPFGSSAEKALAPLTIDFYVYALHVASAALAMDLPFFTPNAFSVSLYLPGCSPPSVAALALSHPLRSRDVSCFTLGCELRRTCISRQTSDE